MFLNISNKSFWYVLRLIRYDILVLTMIILLVSITDNFSPQDQAFPLTIPSLMGTALSLILAFRTSQAYDRWWEGRKVWGAIINDSRSIVRATAGFLANAKDEAGASILRRMAMRQIAWCYALGSSLRKQDAFIQASNFLTKEERKEVARYKNIPNAILMQHSKAIKLARDTDNITEFGRLRLDELVMRLTDSMGKCERIKNTVFPTPYTRIVHVIIYVFAITLCIGIQDYKGFVEVPVTIILTTVFLMLERVAIILQDPWENNPSDLPVSSIARNNEIDLKQMIKDENLPAAMEPHWYYIL
jgi:putative membrane protein